MDDDRRPPSSADRLRASGAAEARPLAKGVGGHGRSGSALALLRRSLARPGGCADVEAYAGRVVDRLDALARAQVAAEPTGRIGLQALIADQMLRFRIREGERLRLEGPDLWFRPWPGHVMALAIHELAINAIEHGALGGDGLLDVVWRLEGERLSLLWRETGGTPTDAPAATGFGMEMLGPVLREEFGAETGLDWSGSGLVCRIAFPWSSTIGSAANEG